jgi:NADH-quinone oxidoreductase subunit L
MHTLFVNKWYFDELYDAVIYRPVIAIGRFANDVVERVVVQGIVAAAVDVVRGVGVIVRGAQSGFVRAYALLLIGGFAALGLYFLIVSS